MFQQQGMAFTNGGFKKKTDLSPSFLAVKSHTFRYVVPVEANPRQQNGETGVLGRGGQIGKELTGGHTGSQSHLKNYEKISTLIAINFETQD